MRWGIVGAGLHARERIAPALAATASERLHGVVAATPDKADAFAAAFPGCIAYPSFEAMLADRAVEAVFVTTPNDRHRAETEAAAAAGRHVLVEKPMALTPADCRAMIDACARAGVALGVGFQQRHHPVHRAIRDLVAEGALGEVVLARAEWHTAYGPWRNWRADPARAGSDVLGAVGVHVLDLLNFLLADEVTEVAPLVDVARDTDQDQTLAIALRYRRGALATVTLTRRARSRLNGVSVLGTRGTAAGVGTLGMAPAGRLETDIDGTFAARDLAVPDLYAAQFEAFAAAVAAGRAPDAAGEDGLAVAASCARILRRGHLADGS